jgi:hypothetical protein
MHASLSSHLLTSNGRSIKQRLYKRSKVWISLPLFVIQSRLFIREQRLARQQRSSCAQANKRYTLELQNNRYHYTMGMENIDDRTSIQNKLRNKEKEVGKLMIVCYPLTCINVLFQWNEK